MNWTHSLLGHENALCFVFCVQAEFIHSWSRIRRHTASAGTFFALDLIVDVLICPVTEMSPAKKANRLLLLRCARQSNQWECPQRSMESLYAFRHSCRSSRIGSYPGGRLNALCSIIAYHSCCTRCCLGFVSSCTCTWRNFWRQRKWGRLIGSDNKGNWFRWWMSLQDAHQMVRLPLEKG